MATKDEMVKALKGLGVTESESKIEGILPLKGDEKATDLADILKRAKAATGSDSSSNQNSAQDTEGTVLVWVKGRSYINDKERINAGLYRIALPVPARLAKSPADVVEVFADAISSRKLTEIAKWSGISHPEDYKDDELLAKITISELKPF